MSPTKLIVHGNAAATANNIAASETLFRLGIAGKLLSQAAFIFVALALYDLFKEVVYKSRFLPRFLGVWLALAGFAWIILSLTSVLLPQYQDKMYAYSKSAIAQLSSSKVTCKLPRRPRTNCRMVSAFVSRMDSINLPVESNTVAEIVG